VAKSSRAFACLIRLPFGPCVAARCGIRLRLIICGPAFRIFG